ncbi:RBR-type E3 ubiquitin transferase [Mycena indigotica]|uniref:RBR-type E3 ubiquitin transferase n=1 Tax=Mycena indigotica TaxID=2126181 RepID=A0A8H6W0A6_9AGAR|nr:RBR-type E3 ubiquitin transferase [Mycena indigotica]KAF7294699.1 RBR-type E3 ubiquitin transferase [Mycena indigotica]
MAPCKLFLRGHCRFGDRCKYSHNEETNTQPRLKRGERPCFAWRDGDCPKGDKCFFAHDPQIREERLRQEQARQEADRRAEQARQRLEAEREAAQRAREVRQQIQRRETARQEAAHTIQRIVLGSSLVTYAAGIAIHDIICGSESCRIRIRQLPLDARSDEILALFTQQGIDRKRLFIVGQKPVDGHLEATLVTTAEEGGAVAIGLEGIDFRQEHLQFDVSETANGMGISATKDSDTLTVACWAPSNAVIATFPSQEIARAKVHSLNRQVCGGRRVKVEMNQLTPGYRGSMFGDVQCSIKITGLPLVLSHETLVQFVGSDQLRYLKPISYDPVHGFGLLQQHIRTVAARDLISMDATQLEGDVDGNIIVKFRFSSWEAAKRVDEELSGKKFTYLGNRILRTRLPTPHQYILSITTQQYNAQRHQWDALAGSDVSSKQAASVVIQNGVRVRIRVVGGDKQAVGSLKVRVESLAGGEALPRELWHRSLRWGSGTQFLNSVFRATGAYARADWKACVVKVFGETAARERAREMVKAEIDRLNASECSILLKQKSIRFFVDRGLAALKEALGEDNATLVIVGGAKIVVRGGDNARQIVDRLIAESLEETTTRNVDGVLCPICYDEISHPVSLGCDHTYCMNCLSHYISSAADTFPLTCLANDATCNTPIPLPTIERFLSPALLQQLFETAYIRYIEQHPNEFKYCKTPDCTQVYRRQTTPATVTCPSCFLKVCRACDEEGHEGMSCDEWKLQGDPGEQERRNQEWAAENGVKRCPVCSVWIEKTEGCNHMTCKCGAHLCWLCVRQFPEGEIYNHLNSAHGGAFDVPAALRPQPQLAAIPRPVENQREMVEQRAREAARAANRLPQNNPGPFARAAPRVQYPYGYGPVDPAVAARQHARLREDQAEREAAQLEQEERQRRIAMQERIAIQERWHQQIEEQRRRRQQAMAEEAARREQNRNWCIVM